MPTYARPDRRLQGFRPNPRSDDEREPGMLGTESEAAGPAPHQLRRLGRLYRLS